MRAIQLACACGIVGFCFALSTPLRAEDAPLADAAERADWNQVQRLLDQGADPNARQVDGMTALLWTVWHDHAEPALQLMEHGADPETANRYGVAPLSVACANGNAKLVERLLAAGADPDTTLPGEVTALMTAARTGRVEVVRRLLEHGADVDATECHGQTALMWAASEGHAEAVSCLLDFGAAPQTRLKSGFTPLFFAVREGRIEVVDVLLAAGGDVNTAMHPRKKSNRVPNSGTSPLLLAVENGHFELAARLLEAGADPNDQRTGYTALHAITWVRKPLRGDGDPPPIGSGKMSSLDLVRKLVAQGADVNARHGKRSAGSGRLNKTDATPFLLAAETADIPLMRLLLELGADPTLTNVDDCTPLLAAAGVGVLGNGDESAGTESEAIEAIKLLLELGADINAVESHRETAMHGAAYKSWTQVVQFLADYGADIDVWNQKNQRGWTPLLIAEGYRPGNFRPSSETIRAIENVMRTLGVEPPPRAKRRLPRVNEEYSANPPQPPAQPEAR